jgi:flagellar biosynthesis protein FlhB
MAADSFQEKTEQPTEKRLSEARKKGQVAQSPEVASCMVILFLSVFFYYTLTRGFDRMFGMYTNCVRNLNLEITVDSMTGIFSLAAYQFIVLVGPVFALLIVLTILSSVMQTGFMCSLEALSVKTDTLNPINGIKKLFSKRSLFEVLKALVKISILAYLLYSLIMRELPSILSMADRETSAIIRFMAEACFSLAVKVGIVFLFIAGLDYLRQRWDQKKEMMMTLQEVKEESKEREGNPQVKSRLRSLQRETARRRMIEDVKKADVVVTNPTTFAVAIRYAPKEMPAPMIVGKGAGFVAERIREVARQHGVLLIENKPVARGLFYAVKVGDYVPEKFYLVVAELLAQVYKMQNRVVL